MNEKFFILNSLGIIRCSESIISASLCDELDIFKLNNEISMIDIYLRALKEVLSVEAEESQSKR